MMKEGHYTMLDFKRKKNPLNQKIDNKKDNYTPPPPPKIESGGKLR